MSSGLTIHLTSSSIILMGHSQLSGDSKVTFYPLRYAVLYTHADQEHMQTAGTSLGKEGKVR